MRSTPWARLVAAALCSAALAASGCSTASGEVVRAGHANIAGWAIYGGSADAGRDLAEVIQRESLDIVGVSEACESQVAAATAEFGGERYDYVFQETAGPQSPLPWTPPPEAGCQYGNALIVRRTLGLGDVRKVELPTADRTEDAQFDPEEDRWVICGTVVAGRPVDVCTTHFTNLAVSPDVRRSQAEAVHATVSRDGAAILVGDFNARSGSPALGPLAGWDDAARSRGVVHVFVRGADPVRRGKVRVGRADHDLLWAEVRATG